MHACYGDSMAEEGITASLMAARELMEAWDDAFQRSQILTSNDEDDTAPLSGRIDGGKLNEFVWYALVDKYTSMQYLNIAATHGGGKLVNQTQPSLLATKYVYTIHSRYGWLIRLVDWFD